MRREIQIPAPIQLKNLSTGDPLWKTSKAGDRVVPEPDQPMVLYRFTVVYLLADPQFSDEKHGNKVKSIRVAVDLERTLDKHREGIVLIEGDAWDRMKDVIENAPTFRKQPDQILLQCIPIIDAILNAKEVPAG